MIRNAKDAIHFGDGHGPVNTVNMHYMRGATISLIYALPGCHFDVAQNDKPRRREITCCNYVQAMRSKFLCSVQTDRAAGITGDCSAWTACMFCYFCRTGLHDRIFNCLPKNKCKNTQFRMLTYLLKLNPR